MLNGTIVTVRPLVEADLDVLARELVDLTRRGAWYPLPAAGDGDVRKAFADDALWSGGSGIFAVTDRAGDGAIIGVVSWQRIESDTPDVELGYRIFDPQMRGRGAASEAVGLVGSYLFAIGHDHRLRLVIHPDNIASRRVAEKTGFTLEATSREAWYDRGAWQDVLIYTVTREEWQARWGLPRFGRFGEAEPTAPTA
ncbi:MAG TPA: GNAT family protein [Candidatus Limnocylindrales bacterium]|nr:GNAT family protein [Candidatus Limnocylindrales bacterium]